MEDLHLKADILALNQDKVMAYIAPEEVAIVKPPDLPPLPLKSEEDFEQFEHYLKKSSNFSRTVGIFTPILSNYYYFKLY